MDDVVRLDPFLLDQAERIYDRLFGTPLTQSVAGIPGAVKGVGGRGNYVPDNSLVYHPGKQIDRVEMSDEARVAQDALRDRENREGRNS